MIRDGGCLRRVGDAGDISSNLALRERGEGGAMTTGATGGVGGYECTTVASESTLSRED